MRRLLYILLVVLGCSSYAATYELRNHELISISGKTFELSGMGTKDVYVEVDGQFGKVSSASNSSTSINGALMRVLDIYEPFGDNPLIVYFDINIEFVCGDGVCASSENSVSCCTDCGCGNESTCFSNQCYNSAANECFIDSECDDGNSCTIDKCSDVPFKCSYESVVECNSNDGCCPDGCALVTNYIDGDLDCLPAPDCESDSDCNDGSDATIDTCMLSLGECNYEFVVNSEIIGTVVNDDNSLSNLAIKSKSFTEKDFVGIAILVWIVFFVSIIIKNYITNDVKPKKEKSKHININKK